MAELDGSVWQEKVVAFRVLPYKARQTITLPDNVEDWIDICSRKLKELVEKEENNSLNNKVYLKDVYCDGMDCVDGELEE